MIRDVGPEAAQRGALRAGVVRCAGNQRPRKGLRGAVGRAADLDDALAVVDSLDADALLRGRVDVVAGPDLVLLRREPQRLDRRARRRRQRSRPDAGLSEPTECLGVELRELL